jgi:hypothetical protein
VQSLSEKQILAVASAVITQVSSRMIGQSRRIPDFYPLRQSRRPGGAAMESGYAVLQTPCR